LPNQSGNVLGGFTNNSPPESGAESMGECVRQALEALPHSDRVTLQKVWLDSFGREPHPKLRKDLMIPILAYRIQENAYGGLKPATKRKLLKIAAAIEGGSEPDLRRKPQIKQGTRIVRVWRGETHQVTVTASGFECRGKIYKSLTEIACEITGTRWSGPMFFGLRKRRAEK
jgi:hypothetical protein